MPSRAPSLVRRAFGLTLALILGLVPALQAAGDPAPVPAPSAVTGPATAALVGSVHTASGAGVALLVLELRGERGAYRTVTGPEGGFRFEGLPPGRYALRLSAPGLALQDASAFDLDAGEARRELVVVPAPLREHLVVSATRSETPASSLGVATSVLDAERLAARESADLVHLLEELPGVSVARAGGVGLQASSFVRGGEARFARVLVDGVPVNEPGGFYNFGTALPFELERVELVRGAASAVYGSDALAGVVHVVSRRAAAGTGVTPRAEAEAGSFDWRRLAGGGSGRGERFDWSAGLQRLETDNQQPNSPFRQTAGAVNAGFALAERTELRLVLRGENGRVGTPGATAYGRPDLDAFYERTDLVAGARLRRAGERIVHELRVGLADSDQLSVDPEDSGCYLPGDGARSGSYASCDLPNPAGFQNDTRRLSLGYQAEAGAGAHQVTLGVDLERETGALGDRRETLLEPERTNWGLYLQDQLVLGGSAFVTLGARLERNGSYGTRVVPRAALAWRLHGGASATTLRASAGLGIKEPDFFQSYGASLFARGNPDLDPERSRSADLGLEQRLWQGRLRAEATLFWHRYDDLIAYTVLDFTTFEGSWVNVGETRARGLELALEVLPLPQLRLSAHYTLLDGEVVESGDAFGDPLYAAGEPLLRRPRHQGHLGAQLVSGRLRAGAQLFLVGERADSDFLGLGLTRNPGHGRLDAHLAWRLAGALEAFVAAENLLDAGYQEVLGYPALGRSLRVGLRFDAGRVGRP
jgi:vitamin B12 transporter